MEETQSNISILQRFVEDFKALIETMIEDFNANELQMENLENHLTEVRENMEMSKQVLSDLQAVRDIFPYHDSLSPQDYFEHMQNHVLEEQTEENEGPIEESRPFPDAWPALL